MFFAKKYGANCSVEKYEQTRSLKVLRLKNFTSIPYISFFYYLVSLVGYSNTLINHTSLFYKLILSSSTYLFFPVMESLFWQLLHATGYVFFLFFLQVCPFFLFVFSYFSVSTDTLSDWFRFLLLCTDVLFLTMIPNQLFDIYIECIHGFHFSFLLSQMTHCIFVTTVLLRLDFYYWSLHRSALLYLSNYPADARLLYWHIFFNEIYPAQISKCRMFPVSRKYFSVFIFPKVTLC